MKRLSGITRGERDSFSIWENVENCVVAARAGAPNSDDPGRKRSTYLDLARHRSAAREEEEDPSDESRTRVRIATCARRMALPGPPPSDVSRPARHVNIPFPEAARGRRSAEKQREQRLLGVTRVLSRSEHISDVSD